MRFGWEERRTDEVGVIETLASKAKGTHKRRLWCERIKRVLPERGNALIEHSQEVFEKEVSDDEGVENRNVFER